MVNETISKKESNIIKTKELTNADENFDVVNKVSLKNTVFTESQNSEKMIDHMEKL